MWGICGECVGNMVLFLKLWEYVGNAWGICGEYGGNGNWERGNGNWERRNGNWERRNGNWEWVVKMGEYCEKNEKIFFSFLLLKLLRKSFSIFLTINGVVPDCVFSVILW